MPEEEEAHPLVTAVYLVYTAVTIGCASCRRHQPAGLHRGEQGGGAGIRGWAPPRIYRIYRPRTASHHGSPHWMLNHEPHSREHPVGRTVASWRCRHGGRRTRGLQQMTKTRPLSEQFSRVHPAELLRQGPVQGGRTRPLPETQFSWVHLVHQLPVKGGRLDSLMRMQEARLQCRFTCSHP